MASAVHRLLRRQPVERIQRIGRRPAQGIRAQHHVPGAVEGERRERPELILRGGIWALVGSPSYHSCGGSTWVIVECGYGAAGSGTPLAEDPRRLGARAARGPPVPSGTGHRVIPPVSGGPPPSPPRGPEPLAPLRLGLLPTLIDILLPLRTGGDSLRAILRRVIGDVHQIQLAGKDEAHLTAPWTP